MNPLGVLQNSATQIDILAARRGDAVERLKEMLHAYRHIAALGGTTPTQTPQPNVVHTHKAPAAAPSIRPALGR
ncbi:hypothetical protein GZL_02468 [Streptomyces sp. 769]|nr:hypothetical protein GZL_02468 [Streptomyces sp. 769]